MHSIGRPEAQRVVSLALPNPLDRLGSKVSDFGLQAENTAAGVAPIPFDFEDVLSKYRNLPKPGPPLLVYRWLTK